jgi:holo-[acyl-carrier protein] synthase
MRILGVGIDLLDSNRITRLYSGYGGRLPQKILSPNELEVFDGKNSPTKRINFIAKRFSVKEALLKAVGIGMGRGIGLTDVTVAGDGFGRPTILLNEASAWFLQTFYNINIKNMTLSVSTSDEGSLISSVVVISGGE